MSDLDDQINALNKELDMIDQKLVVLKKQRDKEINEARQQLLKKWNASKDYTVRHLHQVCLQSYRGGSVHRLIIVHRPPVWTEVEKRLLREDDQAREASFYYEGGKLTMGSGHVLFHHATTDKYWLQNLTKDEMADDKERTEAMEAALASKNFSEDFDVVIRL